MRRLHSQTEKSKLVLEVNSPSTAEVKTGDGQTNRRGGGGGGGRGKRERASQ